MASSEDDSDTMNPSNSLNLETREIAFMGGALGVIFILTVIIAALIVYIRCTSKNRRQVNIGTDHSAEPVPIPGDNVPLTSSAIADRK